MKETLAKLVELQSLADALEDLRLQKEELARLEKENAETRELFEAMLAERSAQIEETREFCAEKESDIKEAEDNTRRARARLTNITSQRELTALNKELDSARRTNQQRSEELLKLMEQLEAASADYEKKKSEYAALRERMEVVEAELAERIAERERHAGEHRARQAELRAGLDRAMVARFDRTVRARKGKAVSDVTATGSCAACRMDTPPQQFIRLQHMSSIENCQHCGRFLVWMSGLESRRPAADIADAAAE
ncbi:MAG: hypothetical protein H6701_05970 [Myxococcales bacterium]|nr:hypothetical protein [Myxococcales bacterium]